MGDLILDTLKKMWDYVCELGDTFIEWMKEGMRKFMLSLLQDDLDVVVDFVDKWIGQHPELKDLWEKEKEKLQKGDTGAFSLLAILIGSMVGTGVGMGLGGFGQDIQNFFNKIRPVKPLPPDVLAYGKHTQRISEEDVKEALLAHGYDEKWHSILHDYNKPKLTIAEILTAEKRLEDVDVEADKRLEELGYNETERKILRELSWAYPSPSDFIRFAVRDVFTEDEEIKSALSAEFPKDIVPYAEKAGMREEVLRWYWMAHWELPSPTQVYEMLHRLHPDVLNVRGDAYKEMGLDTSKLETTLDTVKTYLRQADYDLRWRERLLAISYSPLTRVDLRRVYELGLISDEELLARLMEIGYTKKDAELLMNFYKELKVGAEKDLTKSEILRLFSYGEITEEDTKTMLMDLGYSEEEADFIISIQKAKEREDEIDDLIDTYTLKFIYGEITEEEFITQLDALGIKATRRDKIVEKARRRKEKMVRMPTIKDIQTWFKQKLITEEKARELLTKLRVPEEFHDLYLGIKK